MEGTYTTGAGPDPSRGVFQCDHFVFIDENGGKHNFDNKEACSGTAGGTVPDVTVHIGWSLSPGDMVKLDTTNQNDIIVSTREGKQVHFDRLQNYVGDQYLRTYQPTDFYLDKTPFAFTKIVDRNGNYISLSAPTDANGHFGGVMNITDTLGRNITIDSTGITFPDSSVPAGISHISWSSAAGQSSQVSLSASGCALGWGTSGTLSQSSTTAMDFPPAVNTTITRPDGSAYVFGNDSLGELQFIQFPEGGYKRFFYETMPPQQTYNFMNSSPVVCGSIDTRQVTHKFECASGNCGCRDLTSPNSCSGEVETSYMPTPDSTGLGNHVNVIKSFDANHAVIRQESHSFGVSSLEAPCEFSLVRSDSAGNPLRTISTAFEPHRQAGVPACIPKTVTTTYNDIAPPVASMVTYDYPRDANGNVYWPAFPTKATYSDFGGSTIKIENATYVWQQDSTYKEPQVLDLVASKSLSTAPFTSTTYTYTDTVSASNISTNHAGVPSGSHRGNVSSVTTNGIQTSYTYLDTGNPATSKDSNNNVTSYEYAPMFAGAYLTKVTKPVANGVSHISQFGYDFASGLNTSSTDENNKTTSIDYYYAMRRLKSVTYPDGGESSYDYPDPTHITGVDTVSTSPLTRRTTHLVLDGFGRKLQTETEGVFVDTSYDELGRVHCTSNLYKTPGEPTSGNTCFTYDPLDRVTNVQNPDLSNKSSQFKGPYSKSADESGKSRVVYTDALGRLASVCEVTSTADAAGNNPSPCFGSFGVSGFTTQYGYDSAGNLLSVSQAGISRSFQYDALSRLTYAYNPESGTITYSYLDTNGHVCSGNPSDVCSKTDARGKTTYYAYNDPLNRLTDRTYSDTTTSAAHFQYDVSTEPNAAVTVGRVTYESTSTTGGTQTRRAISQYDEMGRILVEGQCVLSFCSGTPTYNTVQYKYNAIGQITQVNNGMNSSPSIIFTYGYDNAGHLLNVSSTYPEDAQHPGTLFKTTSENYSAMGLTAGNLAASISNPQGTMSFTRTYDKRARLTAESDNGTTPAQPGSATITITGTDQSKNQPTYGTGTVTISGSEQQVPGTKSAGTISVSGTEQSKQVQGQPATSGSGSFTVQGSEQSFVPDTCTLGLTANTKTVSPNSSVCPPVYDTGYVRVIANGYTVTANYTIRSTASSVASSLASGFNVSASPVNASVSGATVTLTAKATGASTNYVVTSSSATNDPADFGGPSFWTNPASFNLTGGHDATSSTVYDAGNVVVTINSKSSTASWGQGSTSQTLAAAISSAINANDSGFLTASASGSVVSLTSLQVASSTNWPITVSVSYDNVNFTSASFAVTATGMSGGSDATYDSGTVTVSVNGTNKSVNYGQGDTSATIASKLATAFGMCPASPAAGISSGSVLTLTSCQSGTSGNYSLSVNKTYDSGHFASASFNPTPSGGALTGGSNGNPIYDSGTVTVTVGGAQAVTTYGQNSTPSSIASDLATKLTGSVVTAIASGPSLTITAVQPGAGSNYGYSVTNSYDTSNFTQASFGATPAAGVLAGGTDATGGTLYSYSLGFEPNGNVTSVNDSVMGQWTYGYDPNNRLTNMTASSGYYAGATVTYPYDRYGNRWTPTAAGNPNLSINQMAMTFTGNDNKIDQWRTAGNYDASGNVVYDNVHHFTYDAESRVTTSDGTGYLYDAEGRRVAKLTGGVLSSIYILSQAGEQLTELNGALGWLHSNVFAEGKLLATYDNSGTHFHITDWLGSRRVQARPDGASDLVCASLPFGDSLNCTGSGTDSTEHHFTGKERDTETGLDYFGARYYGSNMGRFMTPDPLLNSGHPADPQSWNRYSYTLNNPLRFVDPTGLYVWNNTCGKDDSACNAQFQEMQTQFKQALSDVNDEYQKALQNGDTDRADALKQVIDGYGKEGEKNAFGQDVLVGMNSQQSDLGLTKFDGKNTINVTFNLSLKNDWDHFKTEAAHEGSHAGQRDFSMTADNVSRTERAAYLVGSYMSQRYGRFDAYSSGTNPNGTVKLTVLWNPSWKAVDANTYRQSGAKEMGNYVAQQCVAAKECK
jgi:RHS repeat-associated protein